MASLYKQPKSPYWWIKYRFDSRIVRKSTGFRIGVGKDTRSARELQAQHSLQETQQCATGENWSWVGQFLEDRYRPSPKTLNRYQVAWRSISSFLDKNQIRAPRLLTYNHALDYVKWRQQPDDPGLYRCSKNNAIGEVKILGLIMNEAVRRSMAVLNPCYRLGVRKDKPAEKPEMTDTEIATIRQELTRKEKGVALWPAWMKVSFEIAIRQGCRIRECCLPLQDIDLQREPNTITFNAKGGKRFTSMLHPDLVPLIKKLKAEGRTMTCDMPHMPSKAWWMLFKKLKMKHLCFHCIRVTVITRMARDGVPISEAMRFVGHASETIHRVYQRLTVNDQNRCVTSIRMGKST